MRRAEVVEATWHLISEIGLERTTMRRIAAEVECTTGLVSHYFLGKDDILLAALQRVMDIAADRMREQTVGLHGLERLHRLLITLLPLDEPRVREWRVWLAFWGRAYSTPHLRSEEQLQFERWREMIRRSVEEAVAIGDLPAALDVTHEMHHLTGLVLGLGLQAMIGASPPTSSGMIDVVTRQLSLLKAPDGSRHDEPSGTTPR
jgi:TetR/AcrR family transcriptional regulator, transcriptional repressor of bet genes